MKSYLTLLLTILFSCFTPPSSKAQQAEVVFETEGMASYYHDKFEGRPTASGELYKKDSMTAAHPTLPFQTRVMVTNLENKKMVIVRINDRGPFVKSRIIDVSRAAATELDFIDKGLTKVRIEVLTKE